MSKRIARFLAIKCLDFIDWIYANKPEDEHYERSDHETIREVAKLRKEIESK